MRRSILFAGLALALAPLASAQYVDDTGGDAVTPTVDVTPFDGADPPAESTGFYGLSTTALIALVVLAVLVIAAIVALARRRPPP